MEKKNVLSKILENSWSAVDMYVIVKDSFLISFAKILIFGEKNNESSYPCYEQHCISQPKMTFFCFAIN